jgi:hypothetical protein
MVLRLVSTVAGGMCTVRFPKMNCSCCGGISSRWVEETVRCPKPKNVGVPGVPDWLILVLALLRTLAKWGWPAGWRKSSSVPA